MKKKEKLKINLQSRVRKTFFFIITLFSIFIQSFSESRPMNTIESLPIRERTEMSVEVTKISSEKMKGKLNVEEKTISLNFTEIEERVAKNRMRMSEEDYEIFFIEDLNSLPTYSANDMRMNINNRGNNGIGRYNYKTDESSGKKKIKVEYIETPENLYMVVIDKKTGKIVKIFNISEFEVENYATEVTGTVKGISYSYNNTECVLEDWGDGSIPEPVRCRRYTVSQLGASTEVFSGDFPAIAVGDKWEYDGKSYLHKREGEIIPYFSTGESKTIPVIVYLSDLSRTGGANNNWKYEVSIGSSLLKASVYGNASLASKTENSSVSANLNMEIGIASLKKIREIELRTVILMNKEPEGNKITFIQANVGNGNVHKLPKNNDKNYSANLNYPDITVNKIIMENNIILNFKDGYKADSQINFNQNGTLGYTPQQLEVIKSGTYANNFFMTGISSKGTIEVRTNPSNEDPLISYDVGETGRAEAKEFSIVGNSAKINLGYGENGVVNLSIKEWNEEQGYEQELYITHKEESGLIRRRNRVTIKIPARRSIDTGNIGENNNFKFSSEFRNLIIRDYMGEIVALTNNRGEVIAEEDSNGTAGEFPVVAIGNSWSKDIKALETQANTMISEYSYEGNSNKIPVRHVS